MRFLPFIVTFAFVCPLGLAQYFPPLPKGVSTLRSKLYPGVFISYKETHICETTRGVKSYSGYVHLPSSILKDVEGLETYKTSTFFWFFEARRDPQHAPLSIYLAGGPGESSIFTAASESGPCYVNPDSNSTRLNPWSFNNHVNMLYIDQPNQVGFSYDNLVNGTLDLVQGIITPADFSSGIPTPNQSMLVGTFSTQNPNTTANNTALAARALWHFSQSWFAGFPEYQPKNNRISLWANSYGGFFGPASFAYFQKQNKKIRAGKLKGQYLHLDTLGITNGCVDMLHQVRSYPEIAYNNTYGRQFIPIAVYEDSLRNLTQPGGCNDLIRQCRALAAIGDPEYIGSNATVNAACVLATEDCALNVLGAYDAVTGRSDFDMAQFLPQITFPPWYPAGFFNQHWVQAALGVPVNFTWSSTLVQNNFLVGTGDSFRREGIEDLEYLLDSGVKLALVYGDRDYRCNWIGAETLSLNVEYSEASLFRSSGYERIITNKTYNGGVVRQYGNFSFSRVFEAGHGVSAYQPETVYRIFMRSMFNTDVATGKHDTSGDSHYQTKGPASSFGIKNKLPSSQNGDCHIYSVAESCTEEQTVALQEGKAVIKDFVVVNPEP